MDRDGNILFERHNQQHWEVLPYAEAKYLTEEQRVSMREHRTFIHRQHRVPQHGDLVAAMELVGPGTRGGVYSWSTGVLVEGVGAYDSTRRRGKVASRGSAFYIASARYGDAYYEACCLGEASTSTRASPRGRTEACREGDEKGA